MPLIMRADGELVEVDEDAGRPSLVPEIGDDDVLEVVAGRPMSLPSPTTVRGTPLADAATVTATPARGTPVVVGAATPGGREPRERGVSVTGLGERTVAAPRRSISTVGRARPIRERDRRASSEPGQAREDNHAERARELYTAALAQWRGGQRGPAVSTLRLAMGFAPQDARYAEAYLKMTRGEEPDA